VTETESSDQRHSWRFNQNGSEGVGRIEERGGRWISAGQT